ncbi:MAG: carbohydrate ABC transporter permease [Sphaerochaeta sp.]
MIKKTKGEKIFNTINRIFLVILSIFVFYPLYYTFIASVSDGFELSRGLVIYKPLGINFNAYKMIPQIEYFGISYLNTLYYTVFGVTASLCVMLPGAYALSRRRLIGRHFIGFFISFALWFKAGFIPFYLNMNSLNLLDTRFGIIFGFAVNVFYVIILRTYYEGIPVELEEAARIDGLTNWKIFTKIMLPVSVPVIVAIGMYCVISRWNGYFYSMILLKDMHKFPLQVLLKKLIVEMQVMFSVSGGTNFDYSRESMIYAIIVLSNLPIFILFPFAQRYFVKGITVGSVKG